MNTGGFLKILPPIDRQGFWFLTPLQISLLLAGEGIFGSCNFVHRKMERWWGFSSHFIGGGTCGVSDRIESFGVSTGESDSFQRRVLGGFFFQGKHPSREEALCAYAFLTPSLFFVFIIIILNFGLVARRTNLIRGTQPLKNILHSLQRK